jgi:O-acetyl-ADP-ribose deacetylase (regulator of RNase III)
MRVVIAGQNLELTQGDITQQAVDAIVNAANSQLAGGGGVDGAIHRRGGPEIMVETARRYPAGCPTGGAVISSGGLLSARYVIHAVAPRWRGGVDDEAKLLASAYRAALQLAVENNCPSIALPSLGTGAYGYPLDRASRVALGTAIDFLRDRRAPALVRFVLFDNGAFGAFAAALDELVATGESGVTK